MSPLRNIAETPARIPPAGLRVKARIVEAGIAMGDLARAANIAPNTLSDYIAGRCRRRETQMDIHWAFRRLSGLEVSPETFWGTLYWRISA
jgi:lambda repressor-like predicted transcriptional regulator